MSGSESRKCAYIDCGGPIPPRVSGKGPFRKYCSDECRLSVYRGGPKPEKVVDCMECGTPFERDLDLPGAPKKVCSDKCHQARVEKQAAKHATVRLRKNIRELTRNIRTGKEDIEDDIEDDTNDDIQADALDSLIKLLREKGLV